MAGDMNKFLQWYLRDTGLNLVHVASCPDRGFALVFFSYLFIVGLVFLKSFPAHHSLSSQSYLTSAVKHRHEIA